MKRVAPFIAALVFVIVVGTLVWAFLSDGEGDNRRVHPTPGPGAQLPASHTLSVRVALAPDERYA
jgi:hypothetical protein